MKVNTVTFFDLDNLINVLITLLITIVVELVIGLWFGLKKYIKLIVITNLVTNLSLQFLQYNISTLLGGSPYNSYILALLGLEAMVFIVEYIIYKIFMKDQKNDILISYVAVANLASLLSTLIIFG